MKRVGALSLIFVAVIILIRYVFTGAFLAYSPVISMSSVTTGSAVIYNECEIDISYLVSHIDSFIAATEILHGINYRHKIQIIICPYDSDFYRVYGKSYAMASFFPGGKILIPPSSYNVMIQDKDRLERFLLHELSHSLIFQNMSVFKAASYPQWFFEGMAVYASGQAGRDGLLSSKQISKNAESRDRIMRKSYRLTLVSGMKKYEPAELRMLYAVWSAKVSGLVKKHGKTKFYEFVKDSTSHGSFEKIYKTYFGEKVIE